MPKHISEDRRAWSLCQVCVLLFLHTSASLTQSSYIKFLPIELLPTFWTDSEKELLKGTSLAPATEVKINRLNEEFEELRNATDDIEWCHQHWWHPVNGQLAFDDWKVVDALYRSRALEFPGIGDAMVPGIDMANHSSGHSTTAIYEADSDGNGILLLREGKHLERGEEITITLATQHKWRCDADWHRYGDEKGACEMIYSYGFLEGGLTCARDILLDLTIPSDDPLIGAKSAVSSCAPGVRITHDANGIRWESEYIWIICINEEDGLQFQLARTIDSSEELQTTWKDQNVSNTSGLERLLKDDPLWDVFHLRAVALIQDRVEQQLSTLYLLRESSHIESTVPTGDRDRPRALALKLRDLETTLLDQAYESLESQVRRKSYRPLIN